MLSLRKVYDFENKRIFFAIFVRVIVKRILL